MPEKATMPPMKLSPKQIEELKGAKKMMEDARKELNVLKKLGMGVGELEDKLNWADEVQRTLLEEF